MHPKCSHDFKYTKIDYEYFHLNWLYSYHVHPSRYRLTEIASINLSELILHVSLKMFLTIKKTLIA